MAHWAAFVAAPEGNPQQGGQERLDDIMTSDERSKHSR